MAQKLTEHRPIHAPRPHLLTHVGLRCRGRVGRGKKSVVAGLQLTPLIDVLIVMLFFLLVTFKAEGQLLCGCRDLKLPVACLAERISRAPVVAVTVPDGAKDDGVVTLEGSEVATTRELLSDDNPDWKIAKLTERLEVQKHNWRMSNPDRRFPGVVILQSARDADFKVLKKIIYSCGLAGYASMHLAVQLPPRD